MKMHPLFRRSRALSLAAAGSLALLGLTSCGDKAAEETPTAPAAPAAPAEPSAVETARAALFNEAVYALSSKVTDAGLYPALNAEVKIMLEQMEAYYAALSEEGKDVAEKAKMSALIAQVTRDLGAYAKASEAYDRAMADFNALPAEQRDSVEGQRSLSDLESGIGSCLLAQGKAADSLPHYQKALEIAQKHFAAVAPAEPAKPAEEEKTAEGDDKPAEGAEAAKPAEVSPELAQATGDLLDALRCLGDAQRYADDPEEARTTYAKGQDVVNRVRTMPAPAAISYVKLLTAIGNLDNAEGRGANAFREWAMAAEICQKLNASSSQMEVKFETKRLFDSLAPALQNLQKKLIEAQEAAKKDEEAAKAAEAPKPVEIAPAPEAKPAAPKAEAKPAAKPAKPAKKRK